MLNANFLQTFQWFLLPPSAGQPKKTKLLEELVA
jgi:hypothetical protein